MLPVEQIKVPTAIIFFTSKEYRVLHTTMNGENKFWKYSPESRGKMVSVATQVIYFDKDITEWYGVYWLRF